MKQRGKQAHNIHYKLFNGLLFNVTEYLRHRMSFIRGLYAGQTDLVGYTKDQDAIIDFKQTNKPKKREWIDDYFLQLSAYAMAHNILFNTQITKGVIMMCSKDNYYQEFVIEGKEFPKYKHNFLRRVDEYYKTRSKTIGNIYSYIYRITSGEMREMWGRKWYELIKKIGRKLDESKRIRQILENSLTEKRYAISDCPIYIETPDGYIKEFNLKNITRKRN